MVDLGMGYCTGCDVPEPRSLGRKGPIASLVRRCIINVVERVRVREKKHKRRGRVENSKSKSEIDSLTLPKKIDKITIE